MHILHLIHSFPPASHGGTETYVEELARAQKDRGQEATILAGGDGCSEHEILVHEDLKGLDVYRWSALRRSGVAPDGPCPEFSEVYGDFLARGDFDLVHVHHWHNLAVNLIELSNHAGMGTVLSLHDHFSTCPLFFRLREEREFCNAQTSQEDCAACLAEYHSAPLETCSVGLTARRRRFRSEIEAAGALVALSNDQAELLADLPLFKDVNVEILPLPAPTIPDLRQVQVHPDPARFRIISWGGLVRGKGMHLLVEACKLLPEPKRASVHHFGRILDEAYAEELRREADTIDLQLHGPYSQEQMYRQFPTYDLAVFPSLFRETHGFVVDEAMLLGLPVLVSDRGAPGERIGTRGFTFTVGSVEALAEKLTELVSSRASLHSLRMGKPKLGGTVAQHERQLFAVYDHVLGR